MSLSGANDLFGEAAQAYLATKKPTRLLVRSDLPERSWIDVAYLFRSFSQMPLTERQALRFCQGRVLDLGGGVGSHSLYLQKQGLDVTLLDHSAGSLKVARSRGVKKILHGDFRKATLTHYQTILMLMNGIGLCGTLAGLKTFLEKAKKALAPKGQILFDSCDIAYALSPKKQASKLLQKKYYGEVTYTLSFQGKMDKPFPWLFVDTKTVKEIALTSGFHFSELKRQKNGMYLGRLTVN